MEELVKIIKLKESKNINKTANKLDSKLRRRKTEEETTEKEFNEMKEYFTKELTFKDDIILENCSLIIQQQRKHCELMLKKKFVNFSSFKKMNQLIIHQKYVLYYLDLLMIIKFR